MTHKTLYTLFFTLLTLLHANAQEKIILLNEGNWQADNGRMTYFEDGAIVSNQWFREKNGYKLGDTPNDIIQINDNLIAVAINWSNIIQFIRPDGTAVAATENVPNNRKLASDGRYVYVSSYGHECETINGMEYFDKGYVAKIDINTFQVVAATEVGYEPEGIALYRGHLFVANTGGYAFQEGHDYESTVSIVDAETMKVVRTVDTGCINLYGALSQSGRYLLINSAGDYYEHAGCSIIMDCEKALAGEDCCTVLDVVATHSTTDLDGNFLVVGSDYSYITGGYALNYCTINPADATVDESLPGTVGADIENMTQPYSIYVNPYTGYIYATDASMFADAGAMYQWTPEGEYVGRYKVYINPGHFLALKPDGYTSVADIDATKAPSTTAYNLAGQRVSGNYKGIVIKGNKKTFIK